MIGDKLKELRENTGMNKKDFANYIGVKYTTYNGYETGVREPASDFLIMLSKKLDVSIDYIMGLSDEKEKIHCYPLKSIEFDHIKKYRDLDPHGKEMVDMVLDKEHERTLAEQKQKQECTYVAARGGRYKFTKEEMEALAEATKNAPDSSGNKDMF